MSGWRDLTEGMILCELCSRHYSPESFYAYLSQHSKEELELLKKLAKKTLNMTAEQYDDFIVNLEIETYRSSKQSPET